MGKPSPERTTYPAGEPNGQRWGYAPGMTAEEMIIAAVRLAGALLVLRWAFAGSLAAIAIDFSDLFLMNLIDLGGVYATIRRSINGSISPTWRRSCG